MSQAKLLGYFCQWGGYAAAEMAGVAGSRLPEELRIVKVVCTGRLDPVHLVTALSSGYSGVAVVGCEKKICRYETGNWFAQGRVEWAQMILEVLGVSPDRFLMGFASSESRDGLSALLAPFAARVRELGAVGKAEKLSAEAVKAMLKLAGRILGSKEIRWLMGQELMLAKAGRDCFGRPFDQAAYRNHVRAVLERVMAEAKILETLRDESKLIARIAEAIEASPGRTLKLLTDMVAGGSVELERTEERYPVYKASRGR
ncbi:MAG: hydrogenase iron-sulfur subunit [Deltaproteobacteria bacterium]|nr:hydrogenase iron-sulfur subunit [Deltaproteobacteria bacterium]